MRIDNKNCKFNTTSLTENNEIIEQNTITIQKHDVEKIYKVAADNKKNWTFDTVYCPGYFNNKTNFLVGNQKSLVILNENLEKLADDENTIDNILTRKDNGLKDFMIYQIPCFSGLPSNTEMDFQHYNNKGTIQLTMEYGRYIGHLLATDDLPDKICQNQTQTLFANVIIDRYKTKDNKDAKSIKKEILINTNFQFMLGLLEGYQLGNKSKGITINENINIYTFTTILNYLGASYSIRNSKRGDKKLFFQLPRIFEQYTDLTFIQRNTFIIENDHIEKINSDNILDFTEDAQNLKELVNAGKILLVPINSIDFILQENTNVNMYDMTAERHDATNYTVPFSPLLKNSDGDILGVQGVFTKEALQDAQKFSPEHKEYYKSANDGGINNWIADDAILGLYVATK